jgi:hypothetical protein
MTNPTSQQYGAFLQAQLGLAVERMDQSLSEQDRALAHGLYETQGPKLVEQVLQKHTRRRNFGFFSLFESRVLEQKVVVLGVASRFFPIEGADEAILKLGQLVPATKK